MTTVAQPHPASLRDRANRYEIVALKEGSPNLGLSKLEITGEPHAGVGLPGHVTRNAGRASRLLDAKTPTVEAERRRHVVVRWRGAMKDGLDAGRAALAVGVGRATLYRWEKQPELKSRRPHRMRANGWTSALKAEVERLRLDFPFWGKDKLGPLLRKAICVRMAEAGCDALRIMSITGHQSLAEVQT